MSLTASAITTLIEILGKRGASNGLKFSQYTNAEFHKILISNDVNIPKKTKREDLVQLLLLVGSDIVHGDYDNLLNMNRLELKNYFLENQATNGEILSLIHI